MFLSYNAARPVHSGGGWCAICVGGAADQGQGALGSHPPTVRKVTSATACVHRARDQRGPSPAKRLQRSARQLGLEAPASAGAPSETRRRLEGGRGALLVLVIAIVIVLIVIIVINIAIVIDANIVIVTVIGIVVIGIGVVVVVINIIVSLAHRFLESPPTMAQTIKVTQNNR